ncbi:MAG: hypothetical protein KDA65_10600 [Planctomycetaceae bacterium]|nr:hypothetical protein [Planctomycetaceae bacterium]
MNVDQNLIDDIVQGVLQQLQPTSTTGASSPGSNLVISEKLWTADLLAEKIPAAVKVVQQLSGTIVTPSGRDYLRQHQIEVIKGSESSSQSTSIKSRWKVLVVDSSPTFESCWTEMNRGGAIEWTRQRTDNISAAATEGISILCRGEAAGVMVLTGEPEQVACLANRNNQVRAVATKSAERLKQLKSSFQPNMICLDAKTVSYMELRQLVRTI